MEKGNKNPKTIYIYIYMFDIGKVEGKKKGREKSGEKKKKKKSCLVWVKNSEKRK